MSGRRAIGVTCMMHGFGGAPESWRDVRALLPRGESIAPAIFGHGPPREDEASVVTFDDEVDRLARLLPDEPVTLAGYSLGGRLAIGLLARHPARVARAVVIGANPGLTRTHTNGADGARHGAATDAQIDARRDGDDAWAARLERDGIDAFFDAWEDQPLFASQRDLPERALAQQRAIRRAHAPARLAAAMRTLSVARMPSYWAALGAIAVPVTWVAGERDAKFTAIARRAAALTPRGSVAIVPGAGHNVVLEAPGAIAAAIATLR